MRYYLYSRKNDGLFDKEQLRDCSIGKDDLVKAEDADSWIEASKVDDLSDLFEEPADVNFEDEFTEEVETIEAEPKQEDPQPEKNTDDSEKADLPATANPTQLQEMPMPLKRNWMVGFGAILCAMVLLSSNPKKSAHYEVVQQMVSEGLQSLEGSRSWGESLMDIFFRGFGFFDGMAVESLMNDVECHNAFLFSYGKLNDAEEGSHMVTFGILGHVFSMNQEAMNSHISNVLYGHRKPKREQPKEAPRRRKQQELPENGQSL
ncbi:MAG: hypothetical protein MJZ02_04695 [Paludibacteraceae bacterium]|nr:hypothetical protein [Paludibacteraceae bacterium]